MAHRGSSSSRDDILVDRETRLLVQGLGKTGRFHADRSIAYGTNIVAAVSPQPGGSNGMFRRRSRRSGLPDRDDNYRVEVPIFRTVEEAVAETAANASVVFVPPAGAADAIMEAARLRSRSSWRLPRGCGR